MNNLYKINKQNKPNQEILKPLYNILIIIILLVIILLLIKIINNGSSSLGLKLFQSSTQTKPLSQLLITSYIFKLNIITEVLNPFFETIKTIQEFVLMYLQSRFNSQIIRCDSVDNWGNIIEIIRVYPSDIEELKLSYLSIEWFDYIESYYNSRAQMLMNHLMLGSGKTNISSYHQYSICFPELNDLAKTIRLYESNYPSDFILNLTKMFVELYYNSSMSEWSAHLAFNNKIYDFSSIWPNTGIDLPFLKDRSHHLKFFDINYLKHPQPDLNLHYRNYSLNSEFVKLEYLSKVQFRGSSNIGEWIIHKFNLVRF